VCFSTQSVIFTSSKWFLHAESNFQKQCDFDTHKCDYDTYNYDFNTQECKVLHAQCNCHTQSVIFTCSVWLLHAKCNFQRQCDFNTHKCDYNTYNYDFNTQECKVLHAQCNCHTQSVIFACSVWLLHAKCNFQRQCDFNTHKCDYDTYNYDFNTQECKVLHAQCNCHTQSVIFTCSVWLLHAKYFQRQCDFNTHKCDYDT
jgi:hypothetical protein